MCVRRHPGVCDGVRADPRSTRLHLFLMRTDSRSGLRSRTHHVPESFQSFTGLAFAIVLSGGAIFAAAQDQAHLSGRGDVAVFHPRGDARTVGCHDFRSWDRGRGDEESTLLLLRTGRGVDEKAAQRLRKEARVVHGHSKVFSTSGALILPRNNSRHLGISGK